jgi:hypothetical protein
MRPRLLVAVALVAALALPAAAEAKAKQKLQIKTVSNRADLISGGDALIVVRLPKRVRPAKVRVFNGRRNITRYFRKRPNGRFEGLVEGLKKRGRNVIKARAPGARGAKLVIRSHPNGGPVFSGPQIKPWVCQPSARNAKCDQPPEFEFKYMPTSGTGLRDYDPQNPPGDVATTTTDEGEEVPFIVRIETGYQNRDQYKIAVLFDPDTKWKPWRPQPGWNHKLLITHGASCGIDHRADTAPSVTADTVAVEGVSVPGSNSPTEALSRGFAVMSTALNNAGHNCNLVTQAESLVMAKEHLIERYGRIRYTIGTGCSGGSLTQQQVANAYPGIYDGILPQCSFPDAWSTGQQLVDYHLLRLYHEDPSRWEPGVAWTPHEIAAVEGHPNHVNSIVLDSLYWTSLGDPQSGCAGVSDEQLYHPQRNPGGVRCTLADYMVNVLGRRGPKVWSEPERTIGRGFAGMPLDNEGVQYGLAALRAGTITPAQFVDLNEKAGGGDIDIQPTAERLAADQPALRNSYRSGGVNSANNLDRVAIIDLRGPDPGAFHDAYRSWTTRKRLEREHGTYANHVIWFGEVPLIGSPSYTTEGLIAIDRWLAAVEADRGDASRADKVLANRPADIEDRCSAAVPGLERVELPGTGRVCELDAIQTRYGTPRTVAGEGIETDVQKCALKPLRRTDYYPVEFTDSQWARLAATFADGVCDYSQPGVDQRGAIPWLSYDRRVGKVGGKRLGKPPRSRPLKR